MNWTLTAQIVAIVVAYVGGILAIGHFITNSLGKRMDELGKRMDDLKSKVESDLATLTNSFNKRIDDLDTSLNKRIDDLDTSLNRRIDALEKRIDGMDERIDTLNHNFVRHLEFHADRDDKVDS